MLDESLAKACVNCPLSEPLTVGFVGQDTLPEFRSNVSLTLCVGLIENRWSSVVVVGLLPREQDEANRAGHQQNEEFHLVSSLLRVACFSPPEGGGCLIIFRRASGSYPLFT